MKNLPLKALKLLVIGTLLLLSACSSQKPITKVQSATPEYQPGAYYQLINPPVLANRTDNRVEVVEMFFYACPHCYVLEPKLANWLKGKQDIVEFKRIPAILGPSWADQAKAYYVAEKLNILDTIHPALLKAIHVDKRKFYDEYSVLDFFLEQGVDRKSFIDAYNSPYVAEKVNFARAMTVKYGLRGVPALIINGKYKTAQFYTGSQEKMLKVADFLISKEL
ncbi:MAG: thiol:disulfide interchange protein DsbA/DsbL, partial [Methylococcales bacterium]